MAELTSSNLGLDKKIDRVLAVLIEAYGHRNCHSHNQPLDELVATVLSQHTSDINTERAFASLKDAFPDWELVQSAPTAEVEDAIRTGGLAGIKAPRIQAILAAILNERGSYDLDHLNSMSLPDAQRWLVGLPGVGPKTAACVLLFSLGRPSLPVDTHVHRVSKRLGLIGADISAEAAHAILEAGLGDDRDRVYDFHLTMIAHGRTVCTARRPFCERCSLTEHCDYFISATRTGTRPPSAPSPSG
jgi:endonuclease-3